MIDCHLHLQDQKLYSEADGIMCRLREIGVKTLVVNGTGPDDWDRVADLAVRFSEVVPFFGLHPWKVNEVGAGWADLLGEYLERFPESGVGEIGLDKWIRNHDVEKQKEVFAQQLAMACEMRRSVAVHCLQAWGHLLECIKGVRSGASTLLSPILLHSYGGPDEMIEDFVELGAYFSVSGYFFRPEKSEKLAVFEKVPGNRLLIETDAPDMMPPSNLRADDCDSDTNHPANIKAVYKAVADWRRKPLSELIPQTESNARSWCHAIKARETASDKSASE